MNNKFTANPGLLITASGGPMTDPKHQSDQHLLFEVELLIVQQVAKWARVSPKSIYRWIESGDSLPVSLSDQDLELSGHESFS